MVEYHPDLSMKFDPDIDVHQQEVAKLSLAIAEGIGLSNEEKNRVVLAARWHDVGKGFINSEVLKKGELTAEDWRKIRLHPTLGYFFTRIHNFPEESAVMIWQHHESMDGSGYPRELKGKSILLGARIIAVADAIDVIVRGRVYQSARGLDVALNEVQERSGCHYDPLVVGAAVKYLNPLIGNSG